MDYRLIITREAEKQLDEIIDYICVKLNNNEAAMMLLDNIDKIYQNLVNIPLNNLVRKESTYKL
ncbi:MAG: type II toxin-antitoxin system RelE/ParE family toxin [Suipraeoptans sp.]